jgi:1-aminocyclopropane-1-carboxylate deaminase
LDNFQFLNYNGENLLKLDLSDFGIQEANFSIYLDYLHHPYLGGNKIRKLYGWLMRLDKSRNSTLISVSGNSSNYAFALAHLPQYFPLNICLIIRGHKPKVFHETLRNLIDLGTSLHFYSNQEIDSNLNSILAQLQEQYKNPLFIAEYGKNPYLNEGFESLFIENSPFLHADYIFCPVGSGATFEALKTYISPDQKLIGVSSFDSFSYHPYLLENEIWLNSLSRFGGFHPEIYKIMNLFLERYKLPLDPIYTAKMIWEVINAYRLNKIPVSKSVIALHTGGLQGIPVWKTRHNKKIQQIYA